MSTGEDVPPGRPRAGLGVIDERRTGDAALQARMVDHDIVARWKKEAMGQDIDNKHVDWVLAELHDYADQRDTRPEGG